MRKIRFLVMSLLLSATLLCVGCGGSSDSSVAASPYDDKLAASWTNATPTTVNVTVDGTAMKVYQYKIVYCGNPIKMSLSQPQFSMTGYTGETTITDPYQYQTMYVSVPEGSVNDQTKAIYLAVNNSGWKPSVATPFNVDRNGSAITTFVSTTDTDAIGAALKAGYIVVNAGTRSRELRGDDGTWVGKSPAPVVDTKAIIRYLRLNDKKMPGSAERIIITGTSGGGALSVAVAASGNSPDYYPYLAEIGAAGIVGSGSSATSTIKDDVFGTVAYCPINNLGNSDIAYEWQFNAVRTATGAAIVSGVQTAVPVTPALSYVDYSNAASQQPAASAALKALFPAYVNGLKLKLDDGTLLTDTNLPAEIAKQVKAEAERQIQAGVDLTTANFTANNVSLPNDWLTLTGSGTTATATVDYDKYVKFVAMSKQLKTVVAFDACGVTGNLGISGESTLFGTNRQTYSNFQSWSWANNKTWGDGVGFDDTQMGWAQYLASSTNTLAKQIKMINPIDYLNTTSADAAPYWYVRHGGADRDTASSIQIILYYAIKNDPTVKDVNFKLPWLRPHSGNYDVQEAFAWIKAKLTAAGNP